MTKLIFRSWQKNWETLSEYWKKNHPKMNYNPSIGDGCNSDYVCFINGNSEGFDDDDVVWMLYIGINDKNNRKIFNGDICRFPSGQISVIEFKDGGFGWKSSIARDGFVGFAGHPYLHSIIKGIEVIGNIYENPELLKQA